MLSHYRMTNLEEFVEETYKRVGITSPHQITVKELSHRLNVWVHMSDVKSRALEAVPGMYSMFLDSRIDPDKQRLDFLHELCHLLRHAGNQMTMPESFTRMQEIEAEQFVLYATMPFSMISRLELPDRSSLAISFLAETFNVPTELAVQRLDQLQRRTIQGLFSVVTRNYEQEQKYREPAWSSETRRIINQLDRQLISRGLPGYEDHGLV
ncbi:ImmA/IrrE family metallo-endopeptidase [Paenibacillus macerans]|uniref:ImmA/IrrE family metallo-endopeptidase n=1 Tax=Paenibacillus macerans TaxID=44252 RepID=UPI00203C4F2B|nr:ImmA/IrrE family metallo-endopeptidase [Paenibacillus macerans]MCM3699252.1 ImmA/IrrE family metallo-endopeptidase [Paenibacillus macerans]